MKREQHEINKRFNGDREHNLVVETSKLFVSQLGVLTEQMVRFMSTTKWDHLHSLLVSAHFDAQVITVVDNAQHGVTVEHALHLSILFNRYVFDNARALTQIDKLKGRAPVPVSPRQRAPRWA